MTRRSSGGPGIALLLGLLAASRTFAMPSSTTIAEPVVVPAAVPVDAAADRGRCEFGRERAARTFGQLGLWVGLLGGSVAGAELAKRDDGSYDATGSLVGMAVGGLGGWLLGRGLGHVTHPCGSLEWTGRSQGAWSRYEAERKAFESCAKRKGNAVLLGLLAGALVGGGLGYAAGGDDRVTWAIYGVAFGELIGVVLGDYWSPDCRTPMAMRYSGMPLDLPPEVQP